MKILRKNTVLSFILMFLLSCSGGKTPPVKYHKIITTLDANYFDISLVPEPGLLHIGNVEMIDSERELYDFFSSLELPVTAELADVDFQKYTFVFLVSLTYYYDVKVQHEITSGMQVENGLPLFSYKLVEYYKVENRVENQHQHPGLPFYTGVIIPKIEADYIISVNFYSVPR